MARRRETHPALVVTGLAMVLPALVAPASPSPGGLLPLAVAIVLAAGLFAPLALAEWTRRRDVPDDTLDVAVRATGDVWVTLVVGAAAATCMPASPTGIGVAALAWLGAAALVGVAGPAAAAALAAAAVLVALPDAASLFGPAPGWTTLEPHLATWRAWAPTSVIAALLLSGAGFGQWAALPGPIPGAARRPWLVVGLALGAVLVFAVRGAAVWERGLGLPGADPLGVLSASLAVGAAATAVASRHGAAHRYHHAATGFLATLWFAGPARDVLPLWWGTLVFVGPAFSAAVLAARTTGADRVLAVLSAAVLVGAAVWGWPGVPGTAAAAAGAAILVVGVWIAGTRALLRRPA